MQHARPIVRAARKKAEYMRPSLAYVPPQEQPTVTNEDGTKTLRLRQHGNRKLPLPPLMDPIAVEARGRYEKMKPSMEGRTMTDLQKDLAANPFAQALATPVRLCHITQARLPSHFLLPFSSSLKAQQNPNETANGPSSLQVSLIPSAASELPPGTATGSSSYVVNRSDVIKALNTKHRWSSIVTQRMQDVYSKMTGKKNLTREKQWIWDPEMDDRVLEKLQADVVSQLQACLQPDPKVRGPLIMTISQLPMFPRTQLSSILQLGKPPVDEVQRLQDVPKTAKLPQYHLTRLLTTEQLSTLGLNGIENVQVEGRLFVATRVRTIPLQLALSKLQAYIEAV